jgi:hypothetical protein
MTSYDNQQRTQTVTMARPMTASEELTTLRSKTKALVTRSFKEYTEYGEHLQKFYDTRNQAIGPMSPVSIPWIHGPTMTMIHQHLWMANTICERSPITDTRQYLSDLREARNLIQNYHNLLVNINYMVRWIRRENQNFDTVVQMLRHPACQFTHPEKGEPVLPCYLSRLAGEREEARIRKIENDILRGRLPEWEHNPPLDPQGIWDPNNLSTTWPPSRRQAAMEPANRVSAHREVPREPETRASAESSASSGAHTQRRPLTTEGAQPQAYPPYTITQRPATSRQEAASSRRDRSLLPERLQQMSLSDARGRPPARRGSSHRTVKKSYSQAAKPERK